MIEENNWYIDFFVKGFLFIILFQIIYLYQHWKVYKRNEYLKYILYLLIVLTYTIVHFLPLFIGENLYNIHHLYYLLFKRTLAFLIYYTYYVFVFDFLEFKLLSNKLHFQIHIAKYTILSFSFIYLIYGILTFNKQDSLLYMVFSLLIFFASIYFIYKLWKIKTKYSSFFLRGSVYALTGAFVSNMLNLFNTENIYLEVIAVTFPFIGLLLETYYFSSGLAYKSFVLEKESAKNKSKLIHQLELNQNILIEKNEIQNNISKDLHDDIGSDLSSINFNSQILLQNLHNHELSENLTKKINLNSQEVSQKLKTFIWALDDSKDTLHNFADYIKTYTYNYFKDTGINISFSENITNEETKIDGFARKHLFLSIKECLNNIAKHSKATESLVTILYSKGFLQIIIKDNGIGLKAENPFGNGLHNIRKRIENLGGTVTFKNENGTKISIEVKL